MSFLIYIFQRFIDVLQLRCQGRKISAHVGGNFFTTMNAFIFLNVLRDFFGDGVVMSENVAKYFFHACRFWNEFSSIWDTRKNI